MLGGGASCQASSQSVSRVSIACSDFPVLVVATSSRPGSIPAQVAMELLHTVELAPPTETQRLAMLQGLASDHLTAPGIAWTQLARQTAVSAATPRSF